MENAWIHLHQIHKKLHRSLWLQIEIFLDKNREDSGTIIYSNVRGDISRKPRLMNNTTY